VRDIVDWLSTTEVLEFGPFQIKVADLWGTIDWESVGQQLLSRVVPAVNQGGRTVVVVFSSTVQVLTNILFTFIISVYLAFEIGRLGGYLERAAGDPGYRHDMERILREFGRIWRAYLRGQIVLGFIIGGAVWASLTILGVQNAFGLGVLSGLLEFLPVIGPFIGTAAAALFGIFQPENYLGLSPASYAAVIIGVMMVIQQIENNILVPRIVGESLDLHPLVVIIGVFMGGSLAGLIGAILAAPLLATIKLLSGYTWRKMFDLPPFPKPEVEEEVDRRPYLMRALALLSRVRQGVRGRLKGA
jgi:predicted PurR-regulated permease PerM